jgi:phosphocarrier protein HPr
MSSRRRQIELVNALGLHLRAAHQFARLAQRFQAEVRVHLDGKSVNGKSILEMMTLAAGCGSRLDLEASGLDADDALVALSGLVEARFHEDRRTAASEDAVPRRAETTSLGDGFERGDSSEVP